MNNVSMPNGPRGARDTIPCLSREEEHEAGIASDDWLELAEWQTRKVAAELMILRANVDAVGDTTPAEWDAIEEPLRELWRALDAARRERAERRTESGTHRRARRAGR